MRGLDYFIKVGDGDWQHRPFTEVLETLNKALDKVDADRAMHLLWFYPGTVEIKVNLARIKTRYIEDRKDWRNVLV